MPLNIDWQQILLHLFNFIILFIGLYILLYRPVKEFMQKRIDYYKHMDEEAKNRLAEADSIKADYENKMSAIEQEIQNKKEIAMKDAEHAASLEIQDAKQKAAEILTDAKQTAKLEKERMLKDSQKEIIELVENATMKLLQEKTDTVAFDQFLELSERRK